MNFKALTEKRNDLVNEMDKILGTANEETRGMNEEEAKKFEALEKEVRDIDATLERAEKTRELSVKAVPAYKEEEKKEERSIEEIQEEELRVAMNVGTTGDGGLVVGNHLSAQIIKALKDRSGVYNFFDATTFKGDYKILSKTHSGTAEWVAEAVDPNGTGKASIPKLKVETLKQHRLYRESAITQQMLNSQEINLTEFIKDDISESLVDKIEEAIFKGTGSNQPTGLITGITKKVNLSERGELTLDDLKKTKALIKSPGLVGAKWFMNSKVLLVLDQMKDTTGRPLLQPDLTKNSDYSILGIPVVVTDALPDFETEDEQCLIILANKAAYHTNTQKQLVINTYDDSTYKRAGLIGYGADIYMDGKTKNPDIVAGIFNPGE